MFDDRISGGWKVYGYDVKSTGPVLSTCLAKEITSGLGNSPPLILSYRLVGIDTLFIASRFHLDENDRLAQGRDEVDFPYGTAVVPCDDSESSSLKESCGDAFATRTQQVPCIATRHPKQPIPVPRTS